MYRVYKTRILGCRNTLSSCFKNCSLSPVWSLTQNTQKSWTQTIPIFAGCISYYYYQKWWAVCSLFQKLDFIACRVLDSKVLHWIGRSVRPSVLVEIRRAGSGIWFEKSVQIHFARSLKDQQESSKTTSWAWHLAGSIAIPTATRLGTYTSVEPSLKSNLLFQN